jgi:hypothetical protein
MTSALMLVTAATLGWVNPAELRTLEANDLLAVAFVAQRSFEAHAIDCASPEAVALEIWYPPVPATRILAVARASSADARRDTRYDLRLPYYRFKA